MSKMTDSKYFTTTKKGEIFELKAELNSDRKEKKKEAVKKVIASMTVGKDVRCVERERRFGEDKRRKKIGGRKKKNQRQGGRRKI